MPSQFLCTLVVDGAAEAIRFYERAFGAKELFRLVEPSGRVGHAELELGKTVLMLADEFPEFGTRGPLAYGGTSVTLHLAVENADEAFRRAIEAGATEVFPLRDQFYGDRAGRVRDPFGHEWVLAQRLEELSPEEMQKRYDAMLAGAGAGAT